MGTIFTYTLTRIMKIRNTLIFMVIIMAVIIGVSGGLSEFLSNTGKLTLATQERMTIGIFALMNFLWLAGIPFIVMITGHGTGLIAGEEAEGTLLLLVGKPIRRYEIVAGKFLALVTGALMYLLAMIFTALFVMYAIAGLDPDTLDLLVKILPGILVYACIITVIFSSFSTALSTVFRKKAPAVVIMLGIVMLVYGIFPMFRNLLQQLGYYEEYYIYVFDLNYQLGNMFRYLLTWGSDVRIAPTVQTILSEFTGIYKPAMQSFDYDIGAMPASLEAANYIKPWVSILVWTGSGMAALGFAFFNMHRKDVT